MLIILNSVSYNTYLFIYVRFVELHVIFVLVLDFIREEMVFLLLLISCMKTQQNEGNIIRVSNLASIFSVSTQRVSDTTTGMKSSFIMKRHLQVTEGPQNVFSWM